MGAGWAERIEAIIDCGAALVLGGGGAYAATRAGGVPAVAAAAAAAALFGAYAILRSVAVREPSFTLASFSPVEAMFDPIDELLLTEQVEELLLTEADQFHDREAVLILEDILAKLGEGSRVIRLFDPAALPSASESKARIDRDLEENRISSGPPDASEALHAALSELRRSLR